MEQSQIGKGFSPNTYIVNQNTPSCNTMLSPVMNAAFILILFCVSLNIFTFGPVVKGLAWEMRNVSKPIPLCSRLCIELILIIVRNILSQYLDLMLEGLTSKCWDIRDIQRQIQGNNVSGPNFFRGSRNSGGSEEVDSSQLWYVSSWI